jgi:predicted TIM-barrel fold metal-dependent hydrolase
MAQPERILDAHHHLWDLGAKHRYPWLIQRGIVRFFGDPAPIQRDYLVGDFREDVGALPLVGSVHIQVGVAPGDELAETRWLQKQHRDHGLPSAIVAFCDLAAPDLARRLEAHQQALNLRGIRQIVGRSAEEDQTTGSGALLENPAFLDGLRTVAQHDLSFDLQLIPRQMAQAAALLSQVPELKVALCHAGSLSDFSEDGRALWRRGIRRLAELPNLICKLSGFGMFDQRWTADSIREQFDTALDTFGPQRMAFGSNFPVDKLALPYDAVWQRYFALAHQLPPAEQSSLFHDTAARFYRIADCQPAKTCMSIQPSAGVAVPASARRCRGPAS